MTRRFAAGSRHRDRSVRSGCCRAPEVVPAVVTLAGVGGVDVTGIGSAVAILVVRAGAVDVTGVDVVGRDRRLDVARVDRRVDVRGAGGGSAGTRAERAERGRVVGLAAVDVTVDVNGTIPVATTKVARDVLEVGEPRDRTHLRFRYAGQRE